MIITGPLLAWIQKLAVQHFTLQAQNIFTKATTFTPVFRLLLLMIRVQATGLNLQVIVSPMLQSFECQ